MTTSFTMEIPDRFAAKLEPLHPEGAQHAAAAALRLYLELGELGVKALQARAAHEGMGQAEVVLHLLAAPAVTMTPTSSGSSGSAHSNATNPKPRTKRVSNQDRDLRIAQDYFDGGTTYARLAAKYGLSAIRVTQIVAKARALRAAV